MKIAQNPGKNEAAIGMTRDRMQEQRVRLVVLATCLETGERFFMDDDIEALSGKNANAVNTLYDAAAELSGITESALEDSVKNSESSPDTDW